ncbi:DUF2149 domain-containing protein [Rhodoplanes sp. TEM]|uniref:DUF2149 domain-containing protein n=1 Tax=Rhodoplanes tepidamans TaxID=200616 RepID=A0ABT5J5A8_RHOTP|nr:MULTISPECIES: DUF2149 domain-containing protein [Rhodoplanes]MDC7784698.1 DUF2149 domain-containing protein [Rhodoplanes tepidamans]MDC7982165.1 DUF2149 domain-containing protein [Rhodoplanes sp. TEM]MDQ0356169.1 hypothetical protein [Rhodoplanes tepidamans]
MTLRILEEDEELDPILSVVNLVDVFLVMIGALMMIIAVNPLNPFASETAVAVKNPGRPDMQIVVKDGEKIETYTSTQQIGSGEGVRAGIAYRLKDGSFVYVPETASPGAPASPPPRTVPTPTSRGAAAPGRPVSPSPSP